MVYFYVFELYVSFAVKTKGGRNKRKMEMQMNNNQILQTTRGLPMIF